METLQSKSNSVPSNSNYSLPNEILVQIFYHLDQLSLATAALACKHWCNAARDPDLLASTFSNVVQIQSKSERSETHANLWKPVPHSNCEFRDPLNVRFSCPALLSPNWLRALDMEFVGLYSNDRAAYYSEDRNIIECRDKRSNATHEIHIPDNMLDEFSERRLEFTYFPIDGRETILIACHQPPHYHRHLHIWVKSGSEWKNCQQNSSIFIGRAIGIETDESKANTIFSLQVKQNWWLLCEEESKIFIWQLGEEASFSSCHSAPQDFRVTYGYDPNPEFFGTFVPKDYVWTASENMKRASLIQVYEKGSHAPEDYCILLGALSLGSEPYLVLSGQTHDRGNLIGIFPLFADMKQPWWEFQTSDLSSGPAGEIARPKIKMTVLPVQTREGWLVSVQEKALCAVTTRLWCLDVNGGSRLIGKDAYLFSQAPYKGYGSIKGFGVGAFSKEISAFYRSYEYPYPGRGDAPLGSLFRESRLLMRCPDFAATQAQPLRSNPRKRKRTAWEDSQS